MLVRFLTTFAPTFLVALIISYLWSLIRHGCGVVDWETSLRLVFILGVALPVSAALKK